MTRLSDAAAVLLGRSAYEAPLNAAAAQMQLDSPAVRAIRKRMGGQLQPQSVSQTRWYPSDLEFAELQADSGNIDIAARLMRSARKDGVLSGVLSTRTAGLVRLPKRFRGNDEVINSLELGHDQVRSVFDEMFPPTECALLAADGELLGVGVAELVQVEGRDYPVLVRLDPEFLMYRWIENRWYYRSVAGLLPITPGDGRWILHTPGGRMVPWQHGLWKAIGRAFIRKEHALFQKGNWESKLANPARVAYAPQGSSEAQKQAWFRQVMGWGINTVFGLTPGYEAKLLESNGIGWQSFNGTIDQCNTEMIIAVAGQTVTTDGGAGFQNSDIHKSIRADLIKATADSLAYTLNTQGIPAYIALRYPGEEDAIEKRATVVEWDVTPPKDRNSEATSLVSAANAITLLGQALQSTSSALDIGALCVQFGIPIVGDGDGDGLPDAGKPTLRLIPGGKSEGDVVAPLDAPAGDKTAQDSALNGAQVASLIQIVQTVADGLIPRDAGVAIIKRAFLVDDAGAEELMGSVGKGFVPSNQQPTAEPATGDTTPDAAPRADPSPEQLTPDSKEAA
jgi:hypothetical protein